MLDFRWFFILFYFYLFIIIIWFFFFFLVSCLFQDKVIQMFAIFVIGFVQVGPKGLSIN